MSRTNPVQIVPEAVTEARGIVQRAVRLFRQGGHKTPYAIEQAARELGITSRRARSLYKGEPVHLRAGEERGLLAWYLTLLDKVAHETKIRADELTRERCRLARRLEDGGRHSAPAGGCSSGACARRTGRRSDDTLLHG